jgi:DNA (cytosine-5)-methyltransferase 1
MNELALFAGAGGGLLASKLLGWKTICAVELDWYCRCVLTQRQNERILQPAFPIWDDVCTFDGKPWRGIVDVVSGGFPCQAYSTAAAGKNTADDLWPEMFRIVADVSPRYIFAENVERRAIDRAADDCESLGYKTKAISLSAKDLGADHIRERHWLLAYTNNDGKFPSSINAETRWMSDVDYRIWADYPEELRVDDGMANRLDRLKAIGNGQIPIVAATAWKILSKQYEHHSRHD